MFTIFHLTGCGAAASDDYLPPLVRLRGIVTESKLVLDAPVRAGVVWTAFDVSGGGAPTQLSPLLPVFAGQDALINPQFPSRFDVDLVRVPPAEAMVSVGDIAIAIGTLVLYEDRDDNGRLDLPSIDPPRPGDRVVGVPRAVSLFYFEKARADVTLPGEIPLGFQLARTVTDGSDGLAPPLPCDELPPDPVDPVTEPVPLSTLIEVKLDGAPHFGGNACAQLRDDENFFNCVPAPDTPPQCNADRSGYLAYALLYAGTPCERRILCTTQVCPPPQEGIPGCDGN